MKIFKILLLNFIILFIIFVILECYYANFHGIKSLEAYKNNLTNVISTDEYFTGLYNNVVQEKGYTYAFRKDVNVNSKKKPILFMGCSFAYGHSLEENETVSYQMAQLTKRPVYNRAGSGWGLSQFLYQLRRPDFYDQFKEEPEYLFYIFISDHKARLDKFKIIPAEGVFQPKYIKKNNSLVQQKPKFWDRLAIASHIQYYYEYWFHNVTEDDLKLYFTEAKKALREHWKNTKLVILVYPLEYNCSENLWNELKKEGYEIIYIQDLIDIDLTNHDNKGPDRQHPAAKTWTVVLPKIIKILDIK